MPNSWDFALVVLFAAVWPLYTHFVEWPRHVRRVNAGDPDARVRMFRRTLLQEWAITAAVVAVCVLHARSAATLGLAVPGGWRLALGVALPVTYAALLVLQVPAIARSEKTRARLRERLAPLRPLIPHRALEWRWFMPLAVSAGICEELLLRGYLVWVLTPWLGLFGAATVSAVIFGLAHAYQGVSFGFRAFGAGVFLGLLAIVTGSVLPGMALHALIDLGSGYVSYLCMREPATDVSPLAA